MSYTGYVHCRCFQDGKTITPPFSDELQFNEEGFYFETSKNTSTQPLFRKQAQLEKWKKSACEHPDMEIERSLVANDMGRDGFRQFLLKSGEDKQSAVMQLLTKIGKSPIYAEESSDYLKAIKLVKQRAKLTSTHKLVLREKTSQNLVMIGDYGVETFFARLDNGQVFLLKDEAFYILDGTDRNSEQFPVLFKAKTFYTHVFKENLIGYFEDGNSDVVTSMRGLGSPKVIDTRTDYQVSVETFNNYSYWKTLIDGLEKLLKASQESGNAILWEVN